MRLPMATAAVMCVLAGDAAHAASLEIRDAVVRVTVVPEDRADIQVVVVGPRAQLPLRIRERGDRVTVDGGLGRRIGTCSRDGATVAVEVRGLGPVAYADLPELVVRTPRDVHVEAGGAVFGKVGRSASLDLGNSGCGDWEVADVRGRATVNQAGSGDTRLGASGALKVRVAGSGDVLAAGVGGGLSVSIAGAGAVRVRSIAGPLQVDVAGPGDVVVRGGRATSMKVLVAGSGDVTFGGTADTLRARIAGSGDVRVAAVRGQVTKSIMGSGAVRIGR